VVVCDTAPSAEILMMYAQQKSEFVVYDKENIRQDLVVVAGDFLIDYVNDSMDEHNELERSV